MSLLDFFGNGPDDPRSGQILGLAQGLLSAPGAKGLAAGIGGMNAARQDEMRRKYIQAQIAEQDAQTQERTMRAKQLQAAQDAEMRKRMALPGLFGAGEAQGGPAPQVAAGGDAGGGPSTRINYLRALEAGYSPKEITEMAGLPDAGRPTVARTVEGRDSNGRPVTHQFDQFGRPVGQAVEQWKAPVQVNQGNRQTFVDPVSMQPLNSLQVFQSPDSAASNAVAMRGQNMTDARAREATAGAKLQYDGERGGVVDLRTGAFTPATQGGMPLGAKEKPLTDAQAKALLFSSRMEESDRIVNELAQDGVQASIPGSRAGFGIGSAVNAVSPAKRQQLDQAKRDWINANLRRESGAVIAREEFDNAEKQYFPQIGDSPEVIEQKARNRAIATAGIKAEVPKGTPPVSINRGGATGSFGAREPAQKPPMKGQVLQGYKYKGGDPASQSSWEKQ